MQLQKLDIDTLKNDKYITKDIITNEFKDLKEPNERY